MLRQVAPDRSAFRRTSNSPIPLRTVGKTTGDCPLPCPRPIGADRFLWRVAAELRYTVDRCEAAKGSRASTRTPNLLDRIVIADCVHDSAVGRVWLRVIEAKVNL